jgi:hypothetical protein
VQFFLFINHFSTALLEVIFLGLKTMNPLIPGNTLYIYGEHVIISKTDSIDKTQLIYWHSQNSSLCGLQIKTPTSEKNITFNLK